MNISFDLEKKRAFVDGEEVSFPEEEDMGRLPYYRYMDGGWVFNEERYQLTMARKEQDELEQVKQSMIVQSKVNLSDYLANAAVESDCHGGEKKRYSITSEKQQHLANMIMTTQLAQIKGTPYQPSWNAAGEPCTYDWTLEELMQLAFEMEAAVRPLVSRQQTIEVQIKQAESAEELEQIDISFGGEV